jgi:chromosome segregation ATPase
MSVLTEWLTSGKNRSYSVRYNVGTYHGQLVEDYYVVGEGYAREEDEAMRKALAQEPHKRVAKWRYELRSRRDALKGSLERVSEHEREIAALQAKLAEHGEEEPVTPGFQCLPGGKG